MKRYSLAIDFGNTLAKVGLFEGQKLIKISSSTNPTKEELTKLINRFRVQQCIISSVTKKSTGIERFLSKQVSTIILSDKIPVPVKNNYKTKYSLGKDRLACAVAAEFLFNNKNVLVINCGTCITYDLVNSKGAYLGGGISPGLDMRLKSLHTFTSKLPLIKKRNNNSFIGASTEASILTGVMNGAAYEIDGFINLYKRSFPALKVILSGGDANYFGSQLKNKIFAVPHMVLIGLNQILIYNNAEKI